MLLDIQKATATYGDVAQRLMAYGNNVYPPYFYLAKSRGTSVGSLVTTQTNDILGVIAAIGVSTSNTVVAAAGQYFVQDGAATSTYVPTQFQWWNYGTQLMTLTSGGYLGIGTTSPTTTLSVNGSISTKTPVITGTNYTSGSPYVITSTDYTVIFTNATADQYTTLPTASACGGRILCLQAMGAGSFNLIATNGSVVMPPGGTTLTNIIINTNNYTTCMIQSDGTVWRTLSRS